MFNLANSQELVKLSTIISFIEQEIVLTDDGSFHGGKDNNVLSFPCPKSKEQLPRNDNLMVVIATSRTLLLNKDFKI